MYSYCRNYKFEHVFPPANVLKPIKKHQKLQNYFKHVSVRKFIFYWDYVTDVNSQQEDYDVKR